MLFDWDDDKNRQNIRKHGIDFELAKRIFESPVVTALDTVRLTAKTEKLALVSLMAY